jgi:hypothetical protein
MAKQKPKPVPQRKPTNPQAQRKIRAKLKLVKKPKAKSQTTKVTNESLPVKSIPVPSFLNDFTLTVNQKRFLAAYAITANFYHAAEVVGLSRQCHYKWMKEDPVYPEAFKLAEESSVAELETAARDRALKGSDTLMIFLLKSLRPEKYKDQHQHSLEMKGKVQHVHQVELDLDAMPIELRRLLLEHLEKLEEPEEQPINKVEAIPVQPVVSVDAGSH